MKKRGNTKAQATIFMIIGVLLLIGAGVWYYLVDVTREDITPVPREIEPVHNYVQSCLERSLQDSIIQIGLTGGYTQIPDFIDNNPSSYFEIAPGIKQPYWWFEGIKAVPTLPFINEQAEMLTKQQFVSCVDEFSPLYPIFTVYAQTEPEVSVELVDTGVEVTLDYPLEIIFGTNNTKRTLEKFSAKSQTRLKPMVEFATTIMEREKQDFFIERKAIDLLAMDPDNLPLTEIDFSCSPKTWLVENVRQRLSTLISTNLAYVKIRNTPYSNETFISNPFGNDDYGSSYFNYHYVWDVGDVPSNLKATFEYDLNWPNVFAVRPSRDGVMRAKATEGADVLENFCIHLYHFTYDMIFPVRVTITDVNDPNYLFTFMFQAWIDHNTPSTVDRGVEIFETVDRLTSQEFCEDKDYELTVFTINNVTGEDLIDVDISFTCGRYACQKETTDWMSFGAAAGVTAHYPHCVGALIKAEKEGFQTTQKFIQNDEDGQSVLMFLNPIREFTSYSVVKHPHNNVFQQELLGVDERASILIQAKDRGFTNAALFPATHNVPLTLVEGATTYDVTIRLFENDQLIGGYQDEWTLDLGSMRDANHITFHVIEQPNAHQDPEFLTTVTELSTQIPQPVFSTK